MLKEFIWASLKSQVICLCFFSFLQKVSQQERTVGFYYILLFQQDSHEQHVASDRDFHYVLKKLAFFVLIFCLCLYCKIESKASKISNGHSIVYLTSADI